MKFRRLHFDRVARRRRLTARVDRLDRLESRTTITEPISFTGLAISMLRPLVQLGIMNVFGASNAPSPFVRAKELEKQAGHAVPKPYAIPAKLLKSIDAVASGQHAGGSAGSASGASTGKHADTDSSNDWLTFSTPSAADASDAHGISTPWHAAKGPGGGAAQAPRGGTSASRGIQPTSRGAITPLRLAASTPAASSAGGASAALLAAVAGAGGNGTQIASAGTGGGAAAPSVSLF
jgi:hypothetical protein